MCFWSEYADKDLAEKSVRKFSLWKTPVETSEQMRDGGDTATQDPALRT